MDQEQIDELLPSEANVRAAQKFVESCDYSTSALMAFIAALRHLGQNDEASLLETVIEAFAELELGS